MTLLDELESFKKFKNFNNPFCKIEEVAPYILKFTPKTTETKTTLGLLGLVHGNELIGLPILNTLAESLTNGTLELNTELYLGLGNIPAALKSKRFIEEDLNRCFGKTNCDTIESKRARELETHMLDHCDFLIDIHQTVFSSENPFFIFQYSDQQCLSIIDKWNPITEWNKGIPVVLQENQIGTNTGLSTDEYLRKNGKFGAALELGQLNTDGHLGLGLNICINALDITTEQLQESLPIKKDFKFPIMWLNGTYQAKDSSSHLDEGWKNLKPFTVGQRLGQNESGEITAPANGYMLFPRYRKVNEGEDLFFYCTPYENEIQSVLNSQNPIEQQIPVLQ